MWNFILLKFYIIYLHARQPLTKFHVAIHVRNSLENYHEKKIIMKIWNSHYPFACTFDHTISSTFNEISRRSSCKQFTSNTKFYVTVVYSPAIRNSTSLQFRWTLYQQYSDFLAWIATWNFVKGWHACKWIMWNFKKYEISQDRKSTRLNSSH